MYFITAEYMNASMTVAKIYDEDLCSNKPLTSAAQLSILDVYGSLGHAFDIA